MKERQKTFFSFLLFLAFSQLNISRKSELTTIPFQLSKVNYCQKRATFKFLFLFHFIIIFCTVYSHPLPTRPLFLIVLHNGVKNIHVRKARFVTCIGLENTYAPTYPPIHINKTNHGNIRIKYGAVFVYIKRDIFIIIIIIINTLLFVDRFTKYKQV